MDKNLATPYAECQSLVDDICTYAFIKSQGVADEKCSNYDLPGIISRLVEMYEAIKLQAKKKRRAKHSRVEPSLRSNHLWALIDQIRLSLTTHEAVEFVFPFKRDIDTVGLEMDDKIQISLMCRSLLEEFTRKDETEAIPKVSFETVEGEINALLGRSLLNQYQLQEFEQRQADLEEQTFERRYYLITDSLSSLELTFLLHHNMQHGMNEFVNGIRAGYGLPASLRATFWLLSLYGSENEGSGWTERLDAMKRCYKFDVARFNRQNNEALTSLKTLVKHPSNFASPREEFLHAASHSTVDTVLSFYQKSTGKTVSPMHTWLATILLDCTRFGNRESEFIRLKQFEGFVGSEEINLELLFNIDRLAQRLRLETATQEEILNAFLGKISSCCEQLYTQLCDELPDENANRVLKPQLRSLLSDWLAVAFAGVFRPALLTFIWDQILLSNDDCSVYGRVVLITVLFCRELILNQPNFTSLLTSWTTKLLTLDFIEAWHAIPRLDEENYLSITELNRLTGTSSRQFSIQPTLPDQLSASSPIEDESVEISGFHITNLYAILVCADELDLQSWSYQLQFQYFILEDLIKEVGVQSQDIRFLQSGKFMMEEKFAHAFHVTNTNDLVFPGKRMLLTDFGPVKRPLPIHLFLTLTARSPDQSESYILGWACPSCMKVTCDRHNNTVLVPKVKLKYYKLLSGHPRQSWTVREKAQYYRDQLDCTKVLPAEFYRTANEPKPIEFCEFLSCSLTTACLDPILTQESTIQLQLCRPNAKTPKKRPVAFKLLTEEKETVYTVEDAVLQIEQEESKAAIEKTDRITPRVRLRTPSPDDSQWVPYAQPHSTEWDLPVATTSDCFCIYVDQLRFVPDLGTVYKVTGRIINSGYSEWLSDLEVYPKPQKPTAKSAISALRCPSFPVKKRFVINYFGDKIFQKSSILLLRVYTRRRDDMHLTVLGNCLLSLFDDNGKLNVGGHQKRLHCSLPTESELSHLKESQLDGVDSLPAMSILIRLLPYTTQPIESPPYRERSYRSEDAHPSQLEKGLFELYKKDKLLPSSLREVISLMNRRLGTKIDEIELLSSKFIRKSMRKLLSNAEFVKVDKLVPTMNPHELRFLYRHELGLRLKLIQAAPVDVEPGHFLFVTVKFQKGPQTEMQLPNKFHKYGLDETMIFTSVDTSTPISCPKWTQPHFTTKPYYDEQGVFLVRVFVVPLAVLGKRFVVCQKGFGLPQGSLKRTRERPLSMRHLVAWSIMRPFEHGFLRDGVHELVLFSAPLRSSVAKLVQERGEASLFHPKSRIHNQGVLRLSLEDCHGVQFPGIVRSQHEVQRQVTLADPCPEVVNLDSDEFGSQHTENDSRYTLQKLLFYAKEHSMDLQKEEDEEKANLCLQNRLKDCIETAVARSEA